MFSNTATQIVRPAPDQALIEMCHWLVDQIPKASKSITSYDKKGRENKEKANREVLHDWVDYTIDEASTYASKTEEATSKQCAELSRHRERADQLATRNKELVQEIIALKQDSGGHDERTLSEERLRQEVLEPIQQVYAWKEILESHVAKLQQTAVKNANASTAEQQESSTANLSAAYTTSIASSRAPHESLRKSTLSKVAYSTTQASKGKGVFTLINPENSPSMNHDSNPQRVAAKKSMDQNSTNQVGSKRPMSEDSASPAKAAKRQKKPSP